MSTILSVISNEGTTNAVPVYASRDVQIPVSVTDSPGQKETDPVGEVVSAGAEMITTVTLAAVAGHVPKEAESP